TLTLKSGIKNLFGYGLDGNGDGTPGDDYNITYTTLMLGDYDTTGVLDLIDLAALVQGFKDKDYSYELAPFSGAVPHFTSSPDSSYDIEDLMAFGMTWNWQASLGRSLFRQWEDAGIDIAIETVHDLIYIDIPEGIIAYELQISYNPSHITIYSPENTGDINLTDNDEDSGIYTLLAITEGKLAVPITISGREADIMLSFRAAGQDGEIISQLTRQLSLSAIPDDFSLSQAYPNPFNPVTQIQYAIPGDIHVELIVYDILGRQIAELVNSKKEAGFYKTEWNGNQNASGIYIVKMTAGKYTDYQKLMLLK
ncbi:MAG: T9SS type A sorting domain-containing protein, partial [Candidatus Marinimicrobia bacterium]|nr:T9SS type A sorting domain-containing protein [Candidatus Neomarinimicrobiota bacterium]